MCNGFRWEVERELRDGQRKERRGLKVMWDLRFVSSEREVVRLELVGFRPGETTETSKQ